MAEIPDFSREPIEAEDIDLEDTEVIVGGERLTDERAEQLAEETLAEVRARREARTKHLVPGGKSLSGGSTHSPVLNLRVAADQKATLDEAAKAQGDGDIEVRAVDPRGVGQRTRRGVSMNCGLELWTTIALRPG